MNLIRGVQKELYYIEKRKLDWVNWDIQRSQAIGVNNINIYKHD